MNTPLPILIVTFTGVFAFAVIVCAVFWMSRWRAALKDEACSWPRTEARVQSSEMVANGRYDQLPSFEFCYVVGGAYYIGHFALAAHGDRADALLREMIDKKLDVQYDPKKPSRYYVPQETMGDCEVKRLLFAGWDNP